MSSRKSERLVNLLIALLSTRRYLTRDELRTAIEGYHGSSDSAFERQFERDKEDLRALGITIETGSNDRYFDDEEGYRINRADFELPEITFTPEELSALALAGQVWQDTVAADHTAQAFEALLAGGAAPDPTLVPTVAPQLSVREPDFDVVFDGVLKRRVIGFGYANQSRRLQPWRLLQRRGRWYVHGYDLDKAEDRFYKLSRFSEPAVAQGRPGAFVPPADAKERAQRLEPTPEAIATVALRDGAVSGFLHAEPVAGMTGIPAGFSAWRVAAGDEGVLIAEVLAAGADAVLLDPPHLRARVLEALRKAAA